MKLQSALLVPLTAAALAVSSTYALAAPDVRVSGFGTLGYVTTDTNDAEYRSSLRQHKGATESDGDWGVDSRLGLQTNVTFNETFSAVAQGYISRRDGNSSPDIEWLFLQADAIDGTSLRAGRMLVPTFFLSDFRHVGYAQHWLRTPVEVYGNFLNTSFDGLQSVSRFSMGDYNATVQLSGGQATGNKKYFQIGPDFFETDEQSDRLYSANFSLQRGDWAGRVGYTHMRDVEIISMGRAVNSGNDNFISAGLQYDNGSLLAMAEHIWRRWDASGAEDGALDSEAFYLTTGYRLGSVMPYVTYSAFTPKGEGYPSSMDTRKTTAIGARWDVARNLAVKAQVEEVSGGVGDQFLGNLEHQMRQPTTQVYSIALDFIF
ncbi:MAG: hypothetical protein JJU25_00050 [Halomonas sp.]|nr:porin [Halomonas sp.]MCC5881014.1 hypothetical protein [Halomonas sp.]